jgi:hypothetical protein
MAKPIPPLKPTPQEGGQEENGDMIARQVTQEECFVPISTIQPVVSQFATASAKDPTTDAFAAIPDAQKARLEKQFMNAMKDSYHGSDENGYLLMQEQGGWIVKNPDGTYDLSRLEPTGPITSNAKELYFDLKAHNLQEL